jgi:hypothetical protein
MKGPTGIQKIVEDILEGLIAFIYNLARGYFLLLRYPFLGALRLHVRDQRQSSLHISAEVSLFIAVLIVASGPFWQTERIRRLLEVAAGDRPFGFIASVVTLYILFDLLIRLLARRLSDRRDRNRTTTLIRYAAAVSVVVWGIGIRWVIERPVNELESPWVVRSMFLVAVVIGSYPLTLVLVEMFRRRFLSQRSRWFVVPLIPTIATVVSLNFMAALPLSNFVVDYGLALVQPKDLVVEDESVCFLWEDGTIELAAVVSNNTARPYIFENGLDLTLYWLDVTTLWSFGAIRMHVPQQGAVNSTYLAIPGKKTEVLHFKGKFDVQKTSHSLQAAYDCSFKLVRDETWLKVRLGWGHAKARYKPTQEALPEQGDGEFGVIFPPEERVAEP